MNVQDPLNRTDSGAQVHTSRPSAVRMLSPSQTQSVTLNKNVCAFHYKHVILFNAALKTVRYNTHGNVIVVLWLGTNTQKDCYIETAKGKRWKVQTNLRQPCTLTPKERSDDSDTCSALLSRYLRQKHLPAPIGSKCRVYVKRKKYLFKDIYKTICRVQRAFTVITTLPQKKRSPEHREIDYKHPVCCNETK